MDVGPGEIVAVTGESGSGKSLTALSVLQLLPGGAACSGSIRLGETEILDASEADCARCAATTSGWCFKSR